MGPIISDFSGDFDTIFESPLTLYTINGASHAPADEAILFKAERAYKENSNGRVVQQAWGITTGAYYFRIKQSVNWTSWRQVYDTSLLNNPTLLSPLASALGGMKEKQINNETNLDAIKTTGLYSWVNTASKPQNTPSNVAGGFCVVLSGSGFYRQIVFDGYYGDRGIYLRTTHADNQWSSWEKITTTSV